MVATGVANSAQHTVASMTRRGTIQCIGPVLLRGGGGAGATARAPRGRETLIPWGVRAPVPKGGPPLDGGRKKTEGRKGFFARKTGPPHHQIPAPPFQLG